MKKSLIALAVAGAFAAPAFASSANVDFYGKFRVSVDHINNGIGWQMNDETSRIGFKGAEDLGGGLKAIYQYETGFNAGTGSNIGGTTAVTSTGYTGTSASGGLGSQRNTFVGLAGDFGTALVGRSDTPYKMVGSADLFGDTLADAQNTGGFCIICEDLRVANAIAYVSPTFSGVTLIGAVITGTGTAGTATTQSVNSLVDASSWAVTYANGPLSLGAGYETLGHLIGNATGAASQKAYKLNAGYTIDSLKLGATYEKIKDIGGTSGADSTNYLISAAYGMGPITLAAQYGKRNRNSTAAATGIFTSSLVNGADADLKATTVGVVYSLSKRTNTYIGYDHLSPKGSANYNVVTVGLNHDF